MKLRTKGPLLLLLLGLVALAVPVQASADLRGDWFRKFPWRAADPGLTHHITTLPGDGYHTGIPDGTAIDYDMNLGQEVRSMSQGYARYGSDYDACCTDSWCHLGKWVLVWTADPSGRQDMATYGHLDWGRTELQNTVVLQGEVLGGAGTTGHVEPSCPAYHLHVRYTDWGGGTTRSQAPIQAIDNFAYNTGYQSANSGIGELWYFETLVSSMRQKYLDKGAWAQVGWTYSVPRMPWPDGLWVHLYRAWGREQNFRHNPDPWGKEVEGIYEPAWSPGTAYLVDSPFWDAWEAGALVPQTDPPQYNSISVPLADQGSCPSGSRPDCAAYQLTHLGYLWMYTLGWYAAVWCPDVGIAGQHTKDGYVTMSDVLAVLAYVGCYQGGPPRNGLYYDAWFDADGDTAITMSDVLAVLAAVGRLCRPT